MTSSSVFFKTSREIPIRDTTKNTRKDLYSVKSIDSTLMQLNTSLLYLYYDKLEASNISPDSTLIRLVVHINVADKHSFEILAEFSA